MSTIKSVYFFDRYNELLHEGRTSIPAGDECSFDNYLMNVQKFYYLYNKRTSANGLTVHLCMR